MFSVNKSQNNISFTSLVAQKRLGERVLKEFQQEMGYLKSSSNLELRGLRFENFSVGWKSKIIASMFYKKAKEWHADIMDFFLQHEVCYKKFKDVKDFKTQLVENIRQKGNKANCWEQMMLINMKLLEKGEHPHNIKMTVFIDEYIQANHFFTVYGLKKGAKNYDPTTWGSKAMVVDAWSGIVKPAHEAIKDFEIALSSGRKYRYSNFIAMNDVDKYLVEKDSIANTFKKLLK